MSQILHRLTRVSILVILVLLPLSLSPVPRAEAAAFTVNNLGDAADVNVGDGVCDSSASPGSQCTLRAALEEANANGATADTISFSVAGTISPTTALPDLSSGNTTIAGANQTVTIDGSGLPGGTNCLTITSDFNVIRGLQVLNCTGAAIHTHFGADDNIIGGTTASERNVLTGVSIWGGQRNHVRGNYIGINAAGTAALGNGAGVSFFGGTDNVIGGPTSAYRNVISGSTWQGVNLLADGVDGNTIQNNYIGLNATGTAAIPNFGGVLVQDGPDNNVFRDNVISGNTTHAVVMGRLFYSISGASEDCWASITLNGTLDIRLNGEVIGSLSGTGSVGNTFVNADLGDTIEVRVTSGTGGPFWLVHCFSPRPPAQSDQLIDSVPETIVIPTGYDGDSAGNVIAGNKIGTNASGTSALGNGGHGVAVLGPAAGTTIGGTGAGDGNIIAFNAGDGVRVDGSTATGNTIRANSIHSNSGKGIELLNGGNAELSPPVVTSAGSASGTACANCQVDVFSDSADEGRVYHGSIAANGSGNWTFAGAVAGPKITATATDASGNTSEFSAPFSLSVGGIAELPVLSEGPADEASMPAGGSGWSAGNYAALAGGLAAVVLAGTGGAWYARRRWLS